MRLYAYYSLTHLLLTNVLILQAEYAPLIIATITATLVIIQVFKEKYDGVFFGNLFMLSAIGNASYFWLRIITRNIFGGTPGAMARYTGLILIAYNIGIKFM